MSTNSLKLVPFEVAIENLNLNSYNATQLILHYNSTVSKDKQIKLTEFNGDSFIEEGSYLKLENFYKNDIVSIAEFERRTGIAYNDIKEMCSRCTSRVNELMPAHLQLRSYPLKGTYYLPVAYIKDFANRFVEFKNKIEEIEEQILKEDEREEQEELEKREIAERKKSQSEEEPDDDSLLPPSDDSDDVIEYDDDDQQKEGKEKPPKNKGKEYRKKIEEENAERGKKEAQQKAEDVTRELTKLQEEAKRMEIEATKCLIDAESAIVMFQETAITAIEAAESLDILARESAKKLDELSREAEKKREEIAKENDVSEKRKKEEDYKKTSEAMETEKKKFEEIVQERIQQESYARLNQTRAQECAVERDLRAAEIAKMEQIKQQAEDSHREYLREEEARRQTHTEKVASAIGDKYEDKTDYSVDNAAHSNIIQAMENAREELKQAQEATTARLNEEAERNRQAQKLIEDSRQNATQNVSSAIEQHFEAYISPASAYTDSRIPDSTTETHTPSPSTETTTKYPEDTSKPLGSSDLYDNPNKYGSDDGYKPKEETYTQPVGNGYGSDTYKSDDYTPSNNTPIGYTPVTLTYSDLYKTTINSSIETFHSDVSSTIGDHFEPHRSQEPDYSHNYDYSTPYNDGSTKQQDSHVTDRLTTDPVKEFEKTSRIDTSDASFTKDEPYNSPSKNGSHQQSTETSSPTNSYVSQNDTQNSPITTGYGDQVYTAGRYSTAIPPQLINDCVQTEVTKIEVVQHKDENAKIEIVAPEPTKLYRPISDVERYFQKVQEHTNEPQSYSLGTKNPDTHVADMEVAKIVTSTRENFSKFENAYNSNNENIEIRVVEIGSGRDIGTLGSGNINFENGKASIDIDPNTFTRHTEIISDTHYDETKKQDSFIPDTHFAPGTTGSTDPHASTDPRGSTDPHTSTDTRGSTNTPVSTRTPTTDNKASLSYIDGLMVTDEKGEEHPIAIVILNKETGEYIGAVSPDAIVHSSNKDGFTHTTINVTQDNIRSVSQTIDEKGRPVLQEVDTTNAEVKIPQGKPLGTTQGENGKDIKVIGTGADVTTYEKTHSPTSPITPAFASKSIREGMLFSHDRTPDKNGMMTDTIEFNGKVIHYTFHVNDSAHFDEIKSKSIELIKEGKDAERFVAENLNSNKFTLTATTTKAQIEGSELKKGSASVKTTTGGTDDKSDAASQNVSSLQTLKTYNSTVYKLNIASAVDKALLSATRQIRQEAAQTETAEGIHNMYVTAMGIKEATNVVARTLISNKNIAATALNEFVSNPNSRFTTNIFVHSQRAQTTNHLLKANDVIKRMNANAPEGSQIQLVDLTLGLKVKKGNIDITSEKLGALLKKEKIGDISKLKSEDFEKLLNMDITPSLRKEILANQRTNMLLRQSNIDLSKMTDGEIAIFINSIDDKEIRSIIARRTGVKGLTNEFDPAVVSVSKGLKGRGRMDNRAMKEGFESLNAALKQHANIDATRFKSAEEVLKFLKDNKDKLDQDTITLLQGYASMLQASSAVGKALAGASTRVLARGLRRHLQSNESMRAYYDTKDIVDSMRRLASVYRVGKGTIHKLRNRRSSHLQKRLDNVNKRIGRRTSKGKNTDRLLRKQDRLTDRKNKLDSKIVRIENKRPNVLSRTKKKIDDKVSDAKKAVRNKAKEMAKERFNKAKNSRFGNSKVGKKVFKKLIDANAQRLKMLRKLLEILRKIADLLDKIKNALSAIMEYVLIAIAIIILIILSINLFMFLAGTIGTSILNLVDTKEDIMKTTAGTTLNCLIEYDKAFFGKLDKLQKNSTNGNLASIYGQKVYGFMDITNGISLDANGTIDYKRKEITKVGSPYGKNGFIQIYRNGADQSIARYSNAKDIISVGYAAYETEVNCFDRSGETSYIGYCTNLWQSTHRCVICEKVQNGYVTLRESEVKTLKDMAAFSGTDYLQTFADVNLVFRNSSGGDYGYAGDNNTWVWLPKFEDKINSNPLDPKFDKTNCVNAHAHLGKLYVCSDAKCNGSATNEFDYYCYTPLGSTSDEAKTQRIYTIESDGKIYKNQSVDPSPSSIGAFDHEGTYLAIVKGDVEKNKVDISPKTTDGCDRINCDWQTADDNPNRDANKGHSYYRKTFNGKIIEDTIYPNVAESGKNTWYSWCNLTYKTGSGEIVECNNHSISYCPDTKGNCSQAGTLRCENNACSFHCSNTVTVYEKRVSGCGETTYRAVTYTKARAEKNLTLSNSCCQKIEGEFFSDNKGNNPVNVYQCSGYCPTHYFCKGHIKCNGHGYCPGHTATFCLGHVDLKSEYKIIGLNDMKNGKYVMEDEKVAGVVSNYFENPNKGGSWFTTGKPSMFNVKKTTGKEDPGYVYVKPKNTSVRTYAWEIFSEDWTFKYNVSFVKDTNTSVLPLPQGEIQRILGDSAKDMNLVVNIAMASVNRIPYHENYWDSGGSPNTSFDPNAPGADINEFLDDAFSGSNTSRADSKGRIQAGLNDSNYASYIWSVAKKTTFSNTFSAAKFGAQTALTTSAFDNQNVPVGSVLYNPSNGKTAILVAFPEKNNKRSFRIVECSDVWVADSNQMLIKDYEKNDEITLYYSPSSCIYKTTSTDKGFGGYTHYFKYIK